MDTNKQTLTTKLTFCKTNPWIHHCHIWQNHQLPNVSQIQLKLRYSHNTSQVLLYTELSPFLVCQTHSVGTQCIEHLCICTTYCQAERLRQILQLDVFPAVNPSHLCKPGTCFTNILQRLGRVCTYAVNLSSLHSDISINKWMKSAIDGWFTYHVEREEDEDRQLCPTNEHQHDISDKNWDYWVDKVLPWNAKKDTD